MDKQGAKHVDITVVDDEKKPEPKKQEPKAEPKKQEPPSQQTAQTQPAKNATSPLPSPFKRASSSNRRLKIFVWGDSGTGKTTLALQFPQPAVIDMDKGTLLYGSSFNFDVLEAYDADTAMDSVQWLASQDHEHRTLVIDPITVYWEALQAKWSQIFLRRNRRSKGFKHEYYDFQTKDWLTIKAEMKMFIRAILALDMHVIVTAREKTKYRDGEYMQAAGETFDGEKSMHYMFDIVLRLGMDDKNRHIAYPMKDRTNQLPKSSFEISYKYLESLYGADILKAKAKQVVLPTDEPSDRPKVSAERLAVLMSLFKKKEFSDGQVRQGLALRGVTKAEDLLPTDAEAIIKRLGG